MFLKDAEADFEWQFQAQHSNHAVRLLRTVDTGATPTPSSPDAYSTALIHNGPLPDNYPLLKYIANVWHFHQTAHAARQEVPVAVWHLNREGAACHAERNTNCYKMTVHSHLYRDQS